MEDEDLYAEVRLVLGPWQGRCAAHCIPLLAEHLCAPLRSSTAKLPRKMRRRRRRQRPPTSAQARCDAATLPAALCEQAVC